MSRPHRDIFRPPTTKNVFFYKAGDSGSKAVRIPVNRHNYRTLDALLDDLSHRIPQLSFGARRLCTPSGVHEVSDIDELRHQQSYVCTDKVYSRVSPLDASRSFSKPYFRSGTDFKLFLAQDEHKARLPPLSKSLTNLKKENTTIGEKLVKASKHLLLANKTGRSKSFTKSDVQTTSDKTAKKPPVPKFAKKKHSKAKATTDEESNKPPVAVVAPATLVKRSQSEELKPVGTERKASLEENGEMTSAGLIFSPPDAVEQVRQELLKSAVAHSQSRQSTAPLKSGRRTANKSARQYQSDSFEPQELAAKIEQLDEADLNIIEDDGVSFFNSVPNTPKRTATAKLTAINQREEPQSPVDHFDVETLRSLSAPSTPREKHLIEDLAPLDTNRIKHIQRGRVAGKQISAEQFILPPKDTTDGKPKRHSEVEKKPLSGDTVRLTDSGVSLKAY